MPKAKTDESHTMLSRWCFCVVIAMAAQMLPLTLWSFTGPNGLDGILDSVYVSTAHWIGMLFFEEQMSLGNAPLGLSLLLLTAMLYAVVIGAVIYLLYRLCVRFAPKKNSC